MPDFIYPTPVVLSDSDGNPLESGAALPASTATISVVNSAASSTALLAANESRKGVVMVNTDANAALIKFGATASASSFTIRLTQNSVWVMDPPIYTGVIHGIWEGDGAGALIITEL